MKNIIAVLIICFASSAFAEVRIYPPNIENNTPSDHDLFPLITTTEKPDAETDQFLKAKAFVLKREWDDAADELEKYLKKYPTGKYVDEVLYWLGRTYNTIANNEDSIEEVIKYKEKVVSTIGKLITGYMESLWFDDADKLYTEVGNEFILLGNANLHNKIKDSEFALWNLGEKAKIKALKNLTNLKRPVALVVIKELLVNEPSKEIKKEMLLSLSNFPEQAEEILNDYIDKVPNNSLIEVAKIVLKEIKTELIPVRMHYIIYSADVVDIDNIQDFPENTLIEKSIWVNSYTSAKAKRKISKLFNGNLVGFQSNAYGSTSGSLKKRLQTKFPESKILGGTSTTSHNINGFNIDLNLGEIRKLPNRINTHIDIYNTDTKRSRKERIDFIIGSSFSQTFDISKNNDRLIAIRKGNKAAVILLKFESDIETDLDRVVDPLYSTLFNNVMGCMVHSAKSSFSTSEYTSNVTDYGEAKIEIPGKDGTWTLIGKSVLGDRKNVQFIARGAKLYNHLGELVKEESQIIVPADEPENFKIK